MGFPPCPDSLKAVAHYLKVAEEHENRDVVISYWCRVHALEISLKISTVKTPDVNRLLLALMDWLESTKAEQSNNEGITSKVCAQATVENYALKLFKYADEQDRQENYSKNVVKAFYTAGILMDVLTAFDELSEDIAEKRKYAKWKAAYIHNCLKSGEKPVPGPIESTENEEDGFVPVPKDSTPTSPNVSFPDPPAGSSGMPGPPSWNMNNMFPQPSPSNPPAYISNTEPAFVPASTPTPSSYPSSNMSAVSLDAEQITKAQKYCKWASSALNYDDVNSAVENLKKALYLLQNGKESPE